MKVLYSSKEIRKAVKRLFAAPAPDDRRVALVAYVGAQASKFLPDPNGLEIICALEPGATSARALELLKNNGARIRQSNRLHMKVYFSSARGAVICSANASSNGLSGAGLKEAGVLVDAQEVDIARLIAYAKPRSISAVDLKMLELAGVLDFELASKKVLAFLHQQLGFDLWMVTRAEGDDWIILHSESEVSNLAPGSVLRWADSFCGA